MEEMFFGYNLVIHFPIAILNFVVIAKEFSLEFLQMSQKKHGKNDHLALGIAEFLEVFNDVKWAVDPINYDAEKKIILGP